MKLLVYADLQATEGAERCFHTPGKSLQQHRVELFFDQIRDLFATHECAGVVDLGDTTDDRSAIPVPVIDTLLRGLDPFKGKFNLKIIGNHEQYLRDTSVDVGRLFEGVFRVSHREVVEVEDLLVFLVSFPEDHDALVDWLDAQAARYKGRRKVLLGHFQVGGAALNNGTEALTGVPRATLERFNLCLLGHIHLPQSLGKRVHYVGSPFQQNWGEAGQGKRIGILDTDTLTVEWVLLKGFPIYRQGTLLHFQEAFDPQSEDRWKVTLQSQDESQAFYALPESARVEAIYAYKEAEPTEPEAEPKDWSVEACLERWVSTVPPQELDIEKQDLIEMGLAMIQ